MHLMIYVCASHCILVYASYIINTLIYIYNIINKMHLMNKMHLINKICVGASCCRLVYASYIINILHSYIRSYIINILYILYYKLHISVCIL